MVSIVVFREDASSIITEISSKESESEQSRFSEYKAAGKIQKYVRGFLERRHILRLNEAAVTIQKHWRGYKGRKYYVLLLKGALEETLDNYYNDNAQTIQRFWRGFQTRRRVHDEKIFRRWLQEVEKKNRELHYLTEKFEVSKRKEEEDEIELKAKENVLFILFKMHHLIRTECIPGTYSVLNGRQLSTLEEQVKELNLTEYAETLHIHRDINRRKIEMIPPPKLNHLKFHRKCHEYWFKRTRVGTPSLLGQDKFTELCKRIGCKPDSFREIQDRGPGERENPPMKFPLIETEYSKDINNEEPFTEDCFLFRERRPSKEIHENDFAKVYKKTELSQSYKECKYGPYRPHASETTLFTHKFAEKCKKKRPHGN